MDNPHLNNGRKDAKEALWEILQKYSQDKQKAILNKLLNSNSSPAFITYLRYYAYRSFNFNT